MYRLTTELNGIYDEPIEYDTLKEAYEGLARIAARAAELNDGIERNFFVEQIGSTSDEHNYSTDPDNV